MWDLILSAVTGFSLARRGLREREAQREAQREEQRGKDIVGSREHVWALVQMAVHFVTSTKPIEEKDHQLALRLQLRLQQEVLESIQWDQPYPDEDCLARLQEEAERIIDMRSGRKWDDYRGGNIVLWQKFRSEARQLELQVALEDLAKAEFAIEEAKASVRNIKRQYLTEVRSMGSPPACVKLTLEAVSALLGHKNLDWKGIQGMVRNDGFIASIVSFDNKRAMTKALETKIRNDFLSNPEFSFEKVNRASMACGPLVQWLSAQVNYSEIIDRVGWFQRDAMRRGYDEGSGAETASW